MFRWWLALNPSKIPWLVPSLSCSSFLVHTASCKEKHFSANPFRPTAEGTRIWISLWWMRCLACVDHMTLIHMKAFMSAWAHVHFHNTDVPLAITNSRHSSPSHDRLKINTFYLCLNIYFTVLRKRPEPSNELNWLIAIIWGFCRCCCWKVLLPIQLSQLSSCWFFSNIEVESN